MIKKIITYCSLFLGLVLAVPSLASAQTITVDQTASPTVEVITDPEADSENSAYLSDTLMGRSQLLVAAPARVGDDYSLKIKPGEQTATFVTITNPSDQPITVISSLHDIVINEQDGDLPIVLPTDEPSGQWGIVDWTRLSSAQQHLDPGESKNIMLYFTAPRSAAPGGHYGIVLHTLVTDQESDSAQAANAFNSFTSLQLGNLIYVLVDGPVQENLLVEDFSFDPFHEQGPVNYQLTLRNASNYHLRPEGQITIYSPFGQEVASFPVSSNKNIFPQISRQFAGQWAAGWGFGRYRAELNLTYGQNNDQLVSAQTTFWIFPLRLILLAVLLIMAIVVICLSIKIRRQEKQKNGQTKSHAKK